jgi:hypothetical protein
MKGTGFRFLAYAFTGLLVAMSLVIVGCEKSGPESDAPASGPTTTTQDENLPERYYVLEASFRYVLDGPNAVEDAGISAHVLRPSGEFTPELVASFVGHEPPVTADITIPTDSNGAIAGAIDEATGRLVMLWGAKVSEMQGDQATVSIRYYVSGFAAAGFNLELLRKNGRWEVQSSKREWIS